MPKILIRKAIKRYVKPLSKEILLWPGKEYLVRDESKDFHTEHGVIKSEDLHKKPGSTIKSSTGKEFILLDAEFIDLYRKIKRAPQTMPLKDIGIILAETGIGKQSKIVDAGTGSGALACMLARHAKNVTTYEVRKDFLRIAKQNIDFLGLKNVVIKQKDIYKGIDEKDIDLITLDLPEPWKVVKHAAKALRVGGFIVSFSPSIPQTIDFVRELKQSNVFQVRKVVELIEREWEVEDRKVRPKTRNIGHSGFITFGRKVQEL